jgi:hypothetical protein
MAAATEAIFQVQIGHFVFVNATEFSDGWAQSMFGASYATATVVAEVIALSTKRKASGRHEESMTLRFFEDTRTYTMPVSRAVKCVDIEPPQFKHPGYCEEESEDEFVSEFSGDDSEPAQPEGTASPTVTSQVVTTSGQATQVPPAVSQLPIDGTPTSQPPVPPASSTASATSPGPIDWKKPHGIVDLFANDAGVLYERFPARLLAFDDDFSPINIFLHLLPLQFFQEHVLPATNQGLVSKEQPRCTLNELLQWFGLRMSMTLFRVSHLHDFWRTSSSTLRPALAFGSFGMTRQRFKAINSALRLTLTQTTETERMHLVCREFNKHMLQHFKASWCVCIDESMTRWTNRRTAPVWHFVPRKPCQAGFEYKDLACSDSNIIFALQLVDKDALVIPGLKRMASLQVKLTESAGLWGIPRVMVGDSAFVSVQAAQTLLTKSIHTIYTVKKKKYWPSGVDAEALSKEMETSTSQFNKTIQGQMKMSDDSTTGVNLIAFKGKIKTMLLSNALRVTCVPTSVDSDGSSSSDDSDDEQTSSNRRRSLESRPEVVDIYCKARHAIDDNNNLRMGSNSIEDSWATKRWQHRVLAFLLGLCEANAYCAFKYFTKQKQSHIDFRTELALQLNESMRTYRFGEVQTVNTPAPVTHALRTLPSGRKWDGERWRVQNTCKSPQLTCRGCPQKNSEGKCRKTTTYCICNPAVGVCDVCFRSRHIVAK